MNAVDAKVRFLWLFAAQMAATTATINFPSTDSPQCHIAGHPLATESLVATNHLLKQLWSYCLENNVSPPLLFFGNVCLHCFHFLVPTSVHAYRIHEPSLCLSSNGFSRTRGVAEKAAVILLDKLLAVHFPASLSAHFSTKKKRSRYTKLLEKESFGQQSASFFKVLTQCAMCQGWTERLTLKKIEKKSKLSSIIHSGTSNEGHPFTVETRCPAGPSRPVSAVLPSLSSTPLMKSPQRNSPNSSVLSQLKAKVSASKNLKQQQENGTKKSGFANFLASIQ